MKLQFTKKEKLNIFHTALCNGLYNWNSYGLEIYVDLEQYRAAKALLKQKSDVVYYEDTLLQVLKSGGSLTAIDCEGSEEPCKIVLVEVLTNIKLVPINTLMEFVNEQDDADSADIVLQYCFFGELIYS